MNAFDGPDGSVWVYRYMRGHDTVLMLLPFGNHTVSYRWSGSDVWRPFIDLMTGERRAFVQNSRVSELAERLA